MSANTGGLRRTWLAGVGTGSEPRKVSVPLSRGFAVLRVLLGLILLLAAGLKTHQLATDPLVTLAPRPSALAPLPASLAPLFHSRPFLIAVVECELLFGLVLLSGILPRLTWALSLLCFGGFALVSLYKGMSGDATCGCFGRVPVNPWYTFTLDSAAVLALLRWRPRGESPSHVPTFARPAAVLSVWLVVGTPVAVATWPEPVGTLTDLGELLPDGKTILLKPETWVGKRFPLLDYIDVGERLKEGQWLVLLYHHDCPDCEAALPKYERLSRGLATRGHAARVALIELPPYSSGQSLLCNARCVAGRLSDAQEWIAMTPRELILDGAYVRTVGNGDSTETRDAQNGLGLWYNE